MSYLVVAAAAKKLAKEAEKTDAGIEDKAGESAVLESKGDGSTVWPVHFETANKSTEVVMTVPTYTQIVANDYDRRHFAPAGSFQEVAASQMPCINQIDNNPIALHSTSEYALSCGFNSDAVVFCKELEGSSWSSPANVVFGFNIDQELLSTSNCGTSPNGEEVPSEGAKVSQNFILFLLLI